MVAAARRAGEKRLGAVRGIETEVGKQKLELLGTCEWLRTDPKE
jgi:hypothetical protein